MPTSDDRASLVPPPRPSRPRRVRRWLARVALGIGVLAVVLLGSTAGGLWWLMRTESGRAWLQTTLVDAVNDSGSGLVLSLGALEGSLPTTLVVRDVALADSQGPWLSADELTLAWDPWSLLQGHLRVVTLSSSALWVDRAHVLPASTEDEEDEETSGGGFDPSLLGLLRVDRLALDGTYLGGALTGNEPILFDASGHLGPAETGDGFAATLAVRRIDGRPGDVALTAILSGADLDHLAVDLTAHEDQGGTVTTLAGLPGAAGWSLSLTGDGPAKDWHGTVTGGADGLADLTGTLTADLSSLEAPSLSLALAATPGPAAPDSWRAILTDRLTLALAAALGEDGSMALNTLRLASGALTVTGTATLGAGGNEAPLTARLTAALDHPDLLAALAPLPLSAATLVVNADGTRGTPHVTATLTAQDVAASADGPGVGHLTLDASATPNGPLSDAATAIAVSVTSRADHPTGPAALTDLMTTPVTLSLQGALRPDDLSVTVDSLRVADEAGLALDAQADLTLSQGAAGTASARLRLDDLGRLAPLLGSLNPAGALDLRLSDVSLADDNRVTATLRLAMSDTRLGIDAADNVLGPAPTLDARLAYDPAAGVTVEGLSLDAAGLALTGTASLPADFSTVAAHLEATLADLALVAGDSATGAVQLTADASGPLADPQATLSMQIPQATLAGMAWTDVALNTQAQTLASGAQATVSLTGTGPGGAVSASLTPTLPGYAQLDTGPIKVSAPGLSLTGALKTDLASLLTNGTLALRVDDPGKLSAWGAPPLKGSLATTIALTPSTPSGQNGDTQTVTVKTTAPALSLPDSGLALGALDLRATLTDALGTPDLDAAFTATDGDAGTLAWSRIAVTAKGALADLAVTADIKGTGPTGDLALSTRARVAPPGLADTARVTLAALDLNTGGHTLRLTAPATVALDDGAQVDRLALAVDDGTLSVTGGQTGSGALNVVLSGQNVPLDLADLAGPDAPAVSGRLDLDAKAKGALTALAASFSVTAREVALADVQNGKLLTASANGTLSGGRLTTEASITGFADQPAQASATLPFRPGGATLIPANEPLSASVNWDGPISAVWEWLPLVDHRMSGDLTLKAALDGSLSAPKVDADISLHDGRYEHLTFGTLLTDLNVTASATGSEHVQISLSGADGGTGRLSGSGDIRLTGEGPMGTITLGLDGATLVRRDDMTASADADLKVALDGDHGAVTGTIKSDDVRVYLDRLQSTRSSATDWGDVVTLTDPNEDPMAALDRMAAETQEAAQHAGQQTAGTDGASADASAATEEESAFPISLDITVTLPNKVYVTGQGLDSEWTGTLNVGGMASAPRIDGNIKVRRGTLEAVGKVLDLETGTIEFTGGTPIDPLLDIVALYESEDDVEARVGISGPASDPQLVLSSDPEMPRDEVLSLILFDKTSGELTTLETLQLASALAQLSGLSGGGSPDITGMMRQAVGLDVLKVGGDVSSGEATVEAGSYLSEDVYVGVEQGLDASSSAVTVDVDLGSGFALESRAEQSGDAEVGVQWQLDY